MMSQERARLHPPPAATPFTAAIVAFGRTSYLSNSLIGKGDTTVAMTCRDDVAQVLFVDAC